MNILQLTCHYHPNIGGVETHLSDLVAGLVKRNIRVFVLTYSPLTTSISGKVFETTQGLTVIRIPWLKGFFYKLVKNPLLEFLYLFPGLFLVTPFVLVLSKVSVIHTHGLVAGFIGVFWGKILKKRVVVTTHSIYQFPESGLYRTFVKWIFNSCDHVLTLSKQSKKEIESLEVDSKKISVFTYWIDIDRFKSQYSKKTAKKKIKWDGNFIVLFVGRLVEEKGILVLIDAAKIWNKNITLVIIGTGPLAERIKYQETRVKNIKYLGKIDNKDLPKYYNAADVTIVPSIHEEGFGRVILESLASGTPVIGSSRGAISEAMDESVGKIIKISSRNIVKTVEYFYKHPNEVNKFSISAEKYAFRRYHNNNINTIITVYKT